jgi:hypothetical protein
MVSCASGSAVCALAGFQPPNTVCGAQSCPVDTLITPTCDGNGSCNMSTQTPCASGMCLPDQSDCM